MLAGLVPVMIAESGKLFKRAGARCIARTPLDQGMLSQPIGVARAICVLELIRIIGHAVERA